MQCSFVSKIMRVFQQIQYGGGKYNFYSLNRVYRAGGNGDHVVTGWLTKWFKSEIILLIFRQKLFRFFVRISDFFVRISDFFVRISNFFVRFFRIFFNFFLLSDDFLENFQDILSYDCEFILMTSKDWLIILVNFEKLILNAEKLN